MALALFDLDDTLLDGDSASLWFEYMVAHKLAPASMLAEEEAMMQRYYNGELAMEEYMAFTLRPLAGKPCTPIDDHCRRFAQDVAAPRLYQEGVARLAWHREQGDTIVLISASGEHIVQPIAEMLQIPPSHVLAIELEQQQGCYTGRTRGVLSFREGKVTRLRQWQQQQACSQAARYGYSDSINDLPLLEHVAEPHVVNPAEHLLLEASRRQWPVLRWQTRRAARLASA